MAAGDALAIVETEMTEIDLQSCELCDKESPFDTMSSHGEIWICGECDAAFRAAFKSCEHDWDKKAAYDANGDEGRYCNKCCGFVRTEDFPGFLGTAAPPIIDDSGEIRASETRLE